MPAARGVKTGQTSGLYRNTASDATKYGTPTWALADHVRDLTPSPAWDLQDASIRATAVKLYHPTQKELSFTAMVRCDDVATDYIAFRTAAENGTVVDLLVLDGLLTVEGSRGFRSYFHVSETGQDQSIGSVLYSQFEFKPGFGLLDNGDPAYPKIAVTGATSAVTYTNPTR